MPSAEEWNNRFRSGGHADTRPDPLLGFSERYWPLLPGWEATSDEKPAAGLSALDVASGAGRHAAALSEAGFRVTAADFSEEALTKTKELARSRGERIHAWRVDLEDEQTDLGLESFHLAAVFFFLHRPLFPKLRRCLRPGGLIVYKTYSVDQLKYPGRPSHRMHMLEHNELLRAFEGFRVLHYHEEWDGKGTASLIAQKP